MRLQGVGAYGLPNGNGEVVMEGFQYRIYGVGVIQVGVSVLEPICINNQ